MEMKMHEHVICTRAQNESVLLLTFMCNNILDVTNQVAREFPVCEKLIAAVVHTLED
jgi:hypothetical protein